MKRNFHRIKHSVLARPTVRFRMILSSAPSVLRKSGRIRATAEKTSSLDQYPEKQLWHSAG